jgi:perosamine synthetase
MDDRITALLPDKEPKVKKYNGIKIPVCIPWFVGNEQRYAMDALENTLISGGINDGYIQKLEKEFAKKTGADFATACNSGTSALHVAYRLIGVSPGDEVIVPSFTMVSTVTPLLEMGAIPVFVDADRYGQIDVSRIDEAITPKTKAIVGVHIYGHPCDIDAIEQIAVDHKLKTVYDAAEAHGALYSGKKLGSFGDVVCYSFYANKILATGEGGMVTFRKHEYKKEADRLVDEYFSYERHFWHEKSGYSYRMSNLLAAIGLGQTEKLEMLVEKRRQNYEQYEKGLAGIPGISFLPESDDVVSARWMVGILVDPVEFGITRNELRSRLAAMGVETRTFFIPMHLQPCLEKYLPMQPSPVTDKTFPVAEQLCARGMYLPSATQMAEHSIQYVCDRIWEVKRSL